MQIYTEICILNIIYTEFCKIFYMNDITIRFLEIYEWLKKENLVHTPKEFANEIQVSTSLITEICKKRTNAGITPIQNLINRFPQLNSNWLLTGGEEMLRQNGDDKKVLVPEKSNSGIPMLPFDAFAGIGDSTVVGVNFDTIEERYIVPLFDGIQIDFMLPVRGSSMYPKYSSGDVVACRLVNELLFVQWNKVYVIDSISQGVIMKRLLKGENNHHIICRSENEKYGDFPVPMEDIRSIALVVGVIRLE
jgi:repressor LexA